MKSQAQVSTNKPEPQKRRCGGGEQALSIQEFSDALGVSTFSTARRIKAGDVRVVEFGRRRLIPRSELARILGE